MKKICKKMKSLKTIISFIDWTLLAVLIALLSLKTSAGHFSQADRKNKLGDPVEKSSISRRRNSGETENIEKKVLEMFGMKEKPKPGRKLRPPKLMQHLYKAHMGDFYTHQDNLIQEWEVGFDLPPHHVMSRVNTARSFHHIDEDEHFPGIADHHVRLRFDLGFLPNHEVVGAAELLLHREAVASHLHVDGDHLQRINIYEIIKMSNLSSSAMLHQLDLKRVAPITRLLDTKLIDARNSTWERFDVSVATSRWAGKRKEDNHGLLVEVVTGKGTPAHKARHVRLKRDLHPEIKDCDWLDRRPTLLTYSSDGSGTNLQRRSRQRRSNSSRSHSSKRRDSNSSRKKRRRRKKQRPCARHNLYVDFSDVGWDVWIVAPPGYNAFYCQGQCIFPLAEHLNATNHAIVQTLANSVDSLLVPRPCCVPTNLTSISMLYEDEHRMVVLKSYPNMMVHGCGCR